MIFAALPTGASHGWGIVGMGVAREMAQLAPGQVRLITQQFTSESVGDELVYRELAALQPTNADMGNPRIVNGIAMLEGPLLTCAVDKEFHSLSPNLRGTRTIGHAVFEENVIKPEWLEIARRNFDFIATASTWCTKVLADLGMTNAKTVVQGIDPRIFFPLPGDLADAAREFLRDKFVIFSGGKFEYRKAQDVAIRAVKILQDRHPDVFLINAWFNPWQASFDSMRRSPHLAWPQASGQYAEIMSRLLAHNGMDLSRVIILGPRTNALMARIYRNSDVGLFPNRCEGGTNLVMMEYMACGKPVVATASCGHADVIRPENAFVISTPTEAVFYGPAGPLAQWPEPSLEDTVEKLEQAYQNRDALRAKGEQAGRDLKQFTWGHTALKFLQLLTA
jgi:glycosyltransferase involved in cell wall biosynthesis